MRSNSNIMYWDGYKLKTETCSVETSEAIYQSTQLTPCKIRIFRNGVTHSYHSCIVTQKFQVQKVIKLINNMNISVVPEWVHF